MILNFRTNNDCILSIRKRENSFEDDDLKICQYKT